MKFDSVLLTGRTGFLGSYIYSHLKNRIKKLDTLGRSNMNDLSFDLAGGRIKISNKYELIIHCAGKAHVVPKTKEEEEEFFDINLKGTKHLLDALESSQNLPKSFVFISTVAVYGLDSGNNVNENYPLNASDAYGSSKVLAEDLVQAWCLQHHVVCTILRLPLIAGINPPGNLRAMIEGIKRGYYFNISGGIAKKSIVLAQDVAEIIPIAAEIGGIYNLTDGNNPTFSELSVVISKQLNKSKPISLPKWLGLIVAKIGDLIGERAPINTKKLNKITSDLTFDDTLARQKLGWKPLSVLEGLKIT
ncbi:NAD-dependent epimerase/dehydratase family protein [Pedobacter gandavensis]|uniref:NAD-dependent epimerase/dehydratase family protein n=1 Tax=Pedobacter gandavensis TaxID=2679963 RepID=UPI0029300DAF|nr:NAD-dependent epimerase/dehydratase family protein [Pedobacter gandavensis]